ncbi:MAG TPA: hypothetical protein VM489_06230 [Burkholderiales bacterium]|nr:hypothetical protein [Burkholderiales bacterium]
MKTLAAALFLLAGGIGIAAWLHLSRQPYYPVARVAAPEGIVYTAFSGRAAGEEACRAANERFVEPIRAQCKSCAVEFMRCEREAEAAQQRLAAAQGAHVLYVRDTVIVIAGPDLAAAESCRIIAADLEKHAVPNARCVAPAKG